MSLSKYKCAFRSNFPKNFLSLFTYQSMLFIAFICGTIFLSLWTSSCGDFSVLIVLLFAFYLIFNVCLAFIVFYVTRIFSENSSVHFINLTTSTIWLLCYQLISYFNWSQLTNWSHLHHLSCVYQFVNQPMYYAHFTNDFRNTLTVILIICMENTAVKLNSNVSSGSVLPESIGKPSTTCSLYHYQDILTNKNVLLSGMSWWWTEKRWSVRILENHSPIAVRK